MPGSASRYGASRNRRRALSALIPPPLRLDDRLEDAVPNLLLGDRQHPVAVGVGEVLSGGEDQRVLDRLLQLPVDLEDVAGVGHRDPQVAGLQPLDLPGVVDVLAEDPAVALLLELVR